MTKSTIRYPSEVLTPYLKQRMAAEPWADAGALAKRLHVSRVLVLRYRREHKQGIDKLHRLAAQYITSHT